MADAGPNYSVEKRRLELQKLEHRQTISRQEHRLVEIGESQNMNIARTELANMELDDEADKIRSNQEALQKRIAEIDKSIGLMAKPEKGE